MACLAGLLSAPLALATDNGHLPGDWQAAALSTMAAGIWLGATLMRRHYHKRKTASLCFSARQTDAALIVVAEDGQILAHGKGCLQLWDTLPEHLKDTGLPAALCADILHRRIAMGNAIDSPMSTPTRPHAVINLILLPGSSRVMLLLLRDVSASRRQLLDYQHLQGTLQGARLGLVRFDLDKRVVRCSPQALHNLLGLPSDCDEMPLADWMALLHPDDRPILENALIAPQAAAERQVCLEYRLRHQQEHWEWIEQRLRLPERGDDAMEVVSLCQAITSRKLAEAAMRKREQEFRTLVDNSTDIIARYDLDLRCQFINRSIGRYSPLVRDEHIGKHISEKGWPDSTVAHFIDECRQLMQTWEPRSFELEVALPSRRFIFETRLFPEFDVNGTLTSILTVDREITDTLLARRLLSEENAVMEMIVANQPLADVLAQICAMIETQLADGMCSVMLLDDSGQHLRVASGKQLPPGYLALIEGIGIGPEVGSCGTAAWWKRTIIVEDIATSPLWKNYADVVLPFGLRACWSTPIFNTDRKLLGTFAIYYPTPRTPSPDEMRLVYRSSHITSIALQRDTHERQLYRLATQDSLTGMHNRRQFLELAEHELRRSQRYQQPLAVLMMDLDRFKGINDRYGHAAGDTVIARFAAVCREVLRGSDLAGRLGGEEFAAVLVNTRPEQAVQVAERLREAVGETPVENSGQQIRFTVSVGLTMLTGEGDSIEDALKRADKLLYQAKDSGRNRVCHDDSLALQ